MICKYTKIKLVNFRSIWSRSCVRFGEINEPSGYLEMEE